MADNAAPAVPDAAPAGGNADVAQQAAIAAAEQAVANYEARESAAGGADAETSIGMRDGRATPPTPPRAEDLVDPEDAFSLGIAYEDAGLDEGTDADVDDGEGELEAADEAVEGDLPADVGDEPLVADAGEADADADADERRTVPEDAEERASFLPDAPEGYDLPAVEGHTWQPSGALLWQSLASSVLHGHDAPQGFLDALGTWAVTEMPKVIQEGLKQKDNDQNKAARETLRGSWGDDYQSNLRETTASFESLPENVRSEIKAARLADGRRLAASPAFLTMLHEIARKNSGRAPSISERVKEIRTVMKEDISQYRARGLDVELAQLEARQANGSASAGAAPIHSDGDDQRIAEVQHVLRTDRDRYFRENLDQVYLQLLQKRERRQGQAA